MSISIFNFTLTLFPSLYVETFNPFLSDVFLLGQYGVTLMIIIGNYPALSKTLLGRALTGNTGNTCKKLVLKIRVLSRLRSIPLLQCIALPFNTHLFDCCCTAW